MREAAPDSWWVSIDHRVVGASGASIGVASGTWPSIAASGGAVAVLTEGVLHLFDGSNGDFRTSVEAPFARRVLGYEHGLWLDEERRARHLSGAGRERDVVDLDGGFGLLDADGRRLATQVLGASDYSNLRVLSLRGGLVGEMPRDMRLVSAALADAGVVVAGQRGIDYWLFDADFRVAQAPARPATDVPLVRSDAQQVVASPDGWIEVWLDVTSEENRPTGPPREKFQRVDVIRTARSRIQRVVSGEVVASRVFDVQLLGIEAVGELAYVLLSSQEAGGTARAKDLRVVMLDESLATLASFPLPPGNWTGGFAVCRGRGSDRDEHRGTALSGDQRLPK